MSLPNRLTDPASRASSPVTRLKSLVLAAQLGPMMSLRSPGATASDTSLMAGSPPKDLERPVICSAGVMVEMQPPMNADERGQRGVGQTAEKTSHESRVTSHFLSVARPPA